MVAATKKDIFAQSISGIYSMIKLPSTKIHKITADLRGSVSKPNYMDIHFTFVQVSSMRLLSPIKLKFQCMTGCKMGHWKQYNNNDGSIKYFLQSIQTSNAGQPAAHKNSKNSIQHTVLIQSTINYNWKRDAIHCIHGDYNFWFFHIVCCSWSIDRWWCTA